MGLQRVMGQDGERWWLVGWLAEGARGGAGEEEEEGGGGNNETTPFSFLHVIQIPPVSVFFPPPPFLHLHHPEAQCMWYSPVGIALP